MTKTKTNLTVLIYELKKTLTSMGIYIVVLLLLNLLGVTIITYQIGDVTSAGAFDILFSGAVFMGFVGNMSFSEGYKLHMQNGFTRFEIFKINICDILINSALLAAVSIALIEITEKLTQFSFSITFQLIYGDELNILSAFFLLTTFYMTIATLAYIVTLLFAKFPKKIVVFCLLAVPILISVIIAIAPQLTSTAFLVSLIEGFLFALGIFEESRSVINPIITFAVLSGINLVISLLLMRRIEL